MDSEKKTIRFIDSDYRTLFTIPDGDKITLTFSDGETVTRSCKYLDEYHTQVGSNVFHICEFAECMERNGTAYAPEKPLALPDMCFSTLPSTGELIRIERGSKGYTVLPYSTANTRENRKLADDLNQRRGVYPQQEAAMLAGGMFGWHTPAARIENYTMRGEAVPLLQQKQNRKKPDIGYASKSAVTENERTSENGFLDHPADAYAIYQLKDGKETRDLRFEPLERIQAAGFEVNRANYKLVYTAPLPEKADFSQNALLESLYEQFNIDHPKDFMGHSLSMSDVIALKQNGMVTCHYVDRFGFAELPSFLPDNPLKNAEMSMEDDYGMIDGILNNGKAPALEDKTEKPSFLERLKAKRPKQEQAKKTPARGAGMER